MYLRYLFDNEQSIGLPREFHTYWNTYYAYSGSSIQYVKDRLATNTNRTPESFFIHKKPPREVLARMNTIYTASISILSIENTTNTPSK
jgi:hypothetical protein